MTITATLAGAISMLGNFAFFFGGNRDNNNPLGIVGVLVAMIVAPLAAMLVQMAISRTREYAADRRGAEICGNPLWLASALDKIARERPNASPIPMPSAIRRRPISSSSIRCRASAWTICFRPTRAPTTASRRSQAMARRIRDALASRTPTPASRSGAQPRPRDRGAAQPDPAEPAQPKPTLGPQSDRTQRPVVVTAPAAVARLRRRKQADQADSDRSRASPRARRRRGCSPPSSTPGRRSTG